MSGIKDGKILFYTAPIKQGFRIRVDTSFANDRDIDKGWEGIEESLDNRILTGEWLWADVPGQVVSEIRSCFSRNNIYDIINLGNEAVFLKFEELPTCPLTVVRPAFSVREMIPRQFWSIELVDKDLLEWVVP